MSQLKEIKHDIATSLFLSPCDLDNLMDRDFLHNMSRYGVDRLIFSLEKDDALYYRGEIMHIKKSWAKKNLTDRELDFRTDREKEIDGMTKFARQVRGL